MASGTSLLSHGPNPRSKKDRTRSRAGRPRMPQPPYSLRLVYHDFWWMSRKCAVQWLGTWSSQRAGVAVPSQKSALAGVLRNPLVIFGLVLVAGDGPLVIAYGLAADPSQQWTLLFVLAAFVFGMGGWFCYLVRWHPRCLYSPGEIPEFAVGRSLFADKDIQGESSSSAAEIRAVTDRKVASQKKELLAQLGEAQIKKADVERLVESAIAGAREAERVARIKTNPSVLLRHAFYLCYRQRGIKRADLIHEVKNAFGVPRGAAATVVELLEEEKLVESSAKQHVRIRPEGLAVELNQQWAEYSEALRERCPAAFS